MGFRHANCGVLYFAGILLSATRESGTVGSWQRRLAIINPDYELVAGLETDD